jgi:hypothetical protein
MRNVKTATVDVLKRLEENLAFRDIRRMADGFCSRWLLVGGRVYRTLAEELHGEKCGANESDFDFLCFDTTSQPIQFDGWQKTRGPGSVFKPEENNSSYGFSVKRQAQRHKALDGRKRSSRFEGGRYKSKVDFVAIEDIKEQGTMEDYFSVVPMDIQAIGLDFRTKKIHGDLGIAAVCRKTLKMKNPAALENEGRDPDCYIEGKKESMMPMKFTIDYSIGKHRCYCYPDDIKLLFALGCKCGGV